MLGQLIVEATSISACALKSLNSNPGRRGVVHDVHRRALNILWDSELISVVSPELGSFPNALVARVDRLAELLRVGDKVFRVSEGLIVQGAAPVLFDLRQAACWSPILKPAAPADGWGAVGMRLKFVLRGAGARAGAEGFGPLLAALALGSAPLTPESLSPLCRYARGKITALLRALAASDARRLIRCVRALIGLGAGLTPSGDDLLVGMLAGLAAAADARAVILARAILATPPNRTTILAQTLLRHACEFEFSARLHDVVSAFFAPDPYTLERRALAAVAWGESSGADSLLGLALGLDAAVERRCQGTRLGFDMEQAFHFKRRSRRSKDDREELTSGNARAVFDENAKRADSNVTRAAHSFR